MNRRSLLKLSSVAALASLAPGIGNSAIAKPVGPFRFCLNMSTIKGQKPGLLQSIEIASAAGYDGVELWVRDIEEWYISVLTRPDYVQAVFERQCEIALVNLEKDGNICYTLLHEHIVNA